MVGLYKDPNGDRVFSNKNDSIKNGTSVVGYTVTDAKRIIDTYEKRVKHLEHQLENKKVTTCII